MIRLAFIYNPRKSHTLEAAREWADLVVSFGGPAPHVLSAYDDAQIPAIFSEVDLIITLGGDGTLVRFGRLAAPFGIPTMGVQYGRVGFLSELKPGEFASRARDIVEGKYWLEERVLLCGTHKRGKQTLHEFDALNDIVMSRAQPARVIDIIACIDDGCVGEFTCDGIVVATATGSTAYSFACGGPILPPTHISYLLTLIAPYLNPIRSIGIPSHASVTLTLNSTQSASLTVDGQDDFDLVKGDVVTIRRSPLIAHFARLGSENYFFETIRERLSGVDQGMFRR